MLLAHSPEKRRRVREEGKGKKEKGERREDGWCENNEAEERQSERGVQTQPSHPTDIIV